MRAGKTQRGFFWPYACGPGTAVLRKVRWYEPKEIDPARVKPSFPGNPLSPRFSASSSGSLGCSPRAASKLARKKTWRTRTSMPLFLSFAEIFQRLGVNLRSGTGRFPGGERGLSGFPERDYYNLRPRRIWDGAARELWNVHRGSPWSEGSLEALSVGRPISVEQLPRLAHSSM